MCWPFTFFVFFLCLIHELGVLGADTGLPFCRDTPGSFSAPNSVFAGKTNTHTHTHTWGATEKHRCDSATFRPGFSGWNLFLCSGEGHSAHGDGRGGWPQPMASRTLSPAIVWTRKWVSDPYQHPSITRHKAGAKSKEITAAGAAAYCDDEGAISKDIRFVQDLRPIQHQAASLRSNSASKRCHELDWTVFKTLVGCWLVLGLHYHGVTVAII